MTTFEELWERYGISEEFARKLYNEKEYIERYPKFLGDEEPEWEYLYVSDLGVKFAVTAGWGVREAIRELIQNALDACDDPSKVVLDVTDTRPMFFVIENPSKDKILFDRDITVGTSEKKCYERGMFGRGLKECASVILSQGGTIYIISHDIAYRFVEVPTRGKKYIGVLLGRAKEPLYGRTRVLVWSPQGSPDLYERIIDEILFNPKKYEKCWQFDYLYTCTNPDGTEEHVEIKVAIAYGGRSKLYVRDLYVNDMINVFGRNSLFSYNTPNVPLEESRRNVADSSIAQRMIVSMYETLYYHYPDILDEILDMIVEKRTYRAGRIIYLKLGRLFEGDVISDKKELAEKLISKVIEKYNLNPERTGVASQDEAMYVLPLIDHLRVNAIVIDMFLPPLSVKRLTKLIADILESDYNRAKRSYISIDKLNEETVRELAFTGVDPQLLFMIFSLADTIKRQIHPSYSHTGLPNSKFYVSFGETKYSMGLTRNNEIYVQYKELAKTYSPVDVIETIIHEYAHVASENAPDNTEAFTNTLQRISAIIINALRHYWNWLTFVLAGSGYYIDANRARIEHRLCERDYYIWCIMDDISEYVRHLDVTYVSCECIKLTDLVQYVREINEGKIAAGSIASSLREVEALLEVKITRRMEQNAKECVYPITALILSVVKAGTLKTGNLMVLSVKPTGEYFIARDKLKDRLEKIAEELLSSGDAEYIRFDVYNPYTNKYEIYVAERTGRRETHNWR